MFLAGAYVIATPACRYRRSGSGAERLEIRCPHRDCLSLAQFNASAARSQPEERLAISRLTPARRQSALRGTTVIRL